MHPWILDQSSMDFPCHGNNPWGAQGTTEQRRTGRILRSRLLSVNLMGRTRVRTTAWASPWVRLGFRWLASGYSRDAVSVLATAGLSVLICDLETALRVGNTPATGKRGDAGHRDDDVGGSIFQSNTIRFSRDHSMQEWAEGAEYARVRSSSRTLQKLSSSPFLEEDM